MRLIPSAVQQINQARERGHDLSYRVSEDHDNRYPWRLSLRYLARSINGQEHPTKVNLQWFRTRELAEVAREHLQAQEVGFDFQEELPQGSSEPQERMDTPHLP